MSCRARSTNRIDQLKSGGSASADGTRRFAQCAIDEGIRTAHTGRWDAPVRSGHLTRNDSGAATAVIPQPVSRCAASYVFARSRPPSVCGTRSSSSAIGLPPRALHEGNSGSSMGERRRQGDSSSGSSRRRRTRGNPRHPRKSTHLCSDRVTHADGGATAAKPLADQASSSPPSGGRWVISGEQSRVIFRECRTRGNCSFAA